MTQPVPRDSAFSSPFSPDPLAPPPPPPPPPPAEPSHSQDPLGIDLLHALEDRPPPVVLRLTPRVVGGVGSAAGSDVGSGLTDFLNSAKPTFRTDEGLVKVPLGFYMRGSPGSDYSKELLDLALTKAGITGNDRNLLLVGKGTPALVARATQSLIDEGCLPPKTVGGSEDLGGRVRELMAKYRLGIDCAAYVIGAVSSARGVSPTAAGFQIDGDGLYELGAKGYEKLPPGAVLQPGDIVCLHGKTGRPTEEHRAVVSACGSLSRGAVEASPWLSKDFIAAHASDSWEYVQVDSSWGNYGDPQEGGVARKTWWHDRTTGTWVSPEREKILTGQVPYGHAWYEVFRPKGAQ
jgi:hypothetical protein